MSGKWQDVDGYDFGNFYGWGWFLTMPIFAGLGLLLHKLKPSSFGPGRYEPWWWALPSLLGIFIDDVGTAVGCQGEEEPRCATEGNPGYVQLHYQLNNLGIVHSLTGTFRLAYIIDTLTIVLLWYYQKVTTVSWLFLTFFCFGKAMAGWGWWLGCATKHNNYTVWDFFTYSSKERDCWERHNLFCRDVYNESVDKEKGLAKAKAVKDSRNAYADVKGKDARNPKMWWNDRRRLTDMKKAGSKTATVWLRFLFPHKSIDVCEKLCNPGNEKR